MSAIGIDLGGTKIETQVFDDNWAAIARQRRDTPDNYADLLDALSAQVAWGEAQAGGPLPIGVGAAGLVNPRDGLALTANLAATGKPFPADIARVTGRPITYINDCRALALSEAVFGKGKDQRTVMSLILGTGVGGGICVDGRLLQGPTTTGGEFGHTSAPAHLVAEHGLPIVQCGCGRMGCIETYIAGPGLSRLALHLAQEALTPPQIAAERHGRLSVVWRLWCALTADLVHTLTLAADPDVIVLGGGLTQIAGMADDLAKAAQEAQLPNFATPDLVLAEGGETSGARGAAYAAWQEAQNG